MVKLFISQSFFTGPNGTCSTCMDMLALVCVHMFMSSLLTIMWSPDSCLDWIMPKLSSHPKLLFFIKNFNYNIWLNCENKVLMDLYQLLRLVLSILRGKAPHGACQSVKPEMAIYFRRINISNIIYFKSKYCPYILLHHQKICSR